MRREINARTLPSRVEFDHKHAEEERVQSHQRLNYLRLLDWRIAGRAENISAATIANA